MSRQTKTLALLCGFLLALGGMEVRGQGQQQPSTVADLAVPSATGDSLTLTWSAPSVPGPGGIGSFPAASYDIRYSTQAPGADLQAWWDAATQAGGEPTPGAPGILETWVLTNLQPSTRYYMALRSASTAGGNSATSNVAIGSTLDGIAPAAITDLAVAGTGSNSANLTWTAPGDDDNTGTATQYDVRYRLGADGPLTDANWDDAKTVQATGEPTPRAAGTAERFTVPGLTADTAYFFAIKTADEVPNWSGISNIAAGRTQLPDITPPAAVTDLTASNPWETSILLTWTAPGDDDNTGTATTYDIRYSTSLITSANFAGATPAANPPAPQVSGSPESFRVTGLQTNRTYYFALKTADEVPLWSTLSNVPSGRTPLSSKIVFPSYSYVDYRWRIYLMNPDGTDLTPLTTSGNDSGRPSWSPDGGRIAFPSGRDNPPDDEIYVMNSDGTNQTRLTDSPGSNASPSWSPDGGKIAFHSDRDGDWNIYVMNSDGTNQTRVTNGENYTDPAWSPDGSKIAFDNGSGIFLVSPDGTNETNLTGSGTYPAWSPDGSKIAFVSFRDGNLEIYVMNADGTSQTNLTNNEAEDDWPAWSPDANRIAFASNRDGNYEICVMNSDGTDQTQVTYGTAFNRYPSWSPFFLGPDTTAPGAVLDLRATTATPDSVTLAWTAPADDGYAGFAASQYDVRYSTSPINAGNFTTATQATGAPSPAAPGTPQSFTISGLNEETTYYFALETVDEVPNWSGISNVAQGATLPDTTPPSQITDLAAGSPTGSSVTLTWTAVGDDGDIGTATGYDVRYSTATITAANWDAATQASGEPTPGPAGTAETFVVIGLVDNTTYYFAVEAFDDAATPNYSPLSNVGSAATIPDTVAPAAVTLTAGSPTGTTVRLTWTAPGDDGNVGTAASYDVRYSTSAITQANWAAATQASGEPTPQAAGASESFTVTGLSPNTRYYFALKTADEKGNTSAISNSPSATTLDTVPPAAITDLAAGTPAADSIQLTWTAPGDDGNSGTAKTYDIRYSTATITDANWATATQATGEPAAQAAGTQQSLTVSGLTAGTRHYFAMKTADEVPNWSALSNVAAASTLDTTAPAAITTLAVSGQTLNSVSLSWTAVGDDGTSGTASSYDLRYSTSAITAANWASATQATGEPTPQVAGTSESFTVTGLSADTGYYFAIKAVDDFNNAGALSNVVSGRTLASLSLSPTSGWSMFGVSIRPAQTDLPTWLGISGLPADQWRVVRWTPTTGGYVSEPSTNPLLDAVEGKGFWLWLASGRTLQFVGGRVESTGTAVVPLAAGWNQIATPFEDVSLNWSAVKVKTPTQTVDQAVSLEAVAAAPLVANYAWAYRNGGYHLVHGTIGEIQQLEPWEGLWIRAEQNCDLVMSGQATLAREEEKGRSPEAKWLVRLEAGAGEAKDPDNYLGVADRAYQIAGPPPISDFVDLRFTGGEAPGLAADLRSESQPNLVWNVEVETDLAGAQVALDWPDLSQLPRGYRLTLYDLESGRAQQMRTTSGYVYDSGQGGIRRFRIEASRAAVGALMVANLAVERTRAGTSITYLLSQDASVNAAIYSLSGALVRTLAENLSVAAGQNSIAWDGRDEQGRLLPGGTYLCEVTASGEDGQVVRASRTLTLLR